ncbi:MFS transporter [Tumebacillus sp. ITR2]|uniref:MFS transporter n=1 Tax=Tumebacillus amylolyticus TaxID=2801339 RepID=A0ABS1J8A6_9BACL|nr:MFS transporter [Tumebacillus amylolyticus]MBL0386482.1 MFS transporter [Tumebacillus amylolyticus]
MLSYFQSLLRLPRAVHFYLISEMVFGVAIGMAVIFNFHYLALGFNAQVIGIATACNSIVTALCSYPAGIFTDRFGAKKAMALGVAVATLGYIAIPLASTPLQLYLAQVLLAVGTAFIISCEFPYIMSLCERKEDETTAFNLLIAAFTLTLAVGNILGTHLPSIMPMGSTMYQSTMFLVALLFAIMFVMRLFLPAQSDRIAKEKQAEEKRTSWKVVPSRQVLLYVIYATLAGMTFALIQPLENVIMKERFHLSDDIIGYLVAFNSFLSFLTSLTSPYLMQTAKRRWFLYLGFGGHMLGQLLMGLTVPFYAYAPFLLARGVGSLTVNAFVDASMMKATKLEERGLHSGLRNLFRSFAASGATALSGFIIAGGDYQTPYFLAFLLVAVQMAFFMVSIRHQLREDLQESF